jgi:hypothetical protein
LPPEKLSERDTRRKCVGDFPETEFVIANQNRQRDKSAQKTAVINAARTQKIKRKDIDVIFGKKHQNL